MVPIPPHGPAKAVAESLKGQTIVCPDLASLYADWKVDLHQDYSMVRQQLEVWLDRWVPTDRERKSQRKVDSAMLSGYFWTGVPLERYRVLAEFMSWYFLWDDEIDCGSLQHDSEGTRQYRQDTIAFLKHCLEPRSNPGMPVGKKHNSGCFESIGAHLQTGQSSDALRRYARDVYAYVNSVASHQAQRQVGLSTMESYIKRRMRTIGAYPCITILEWAYGLDIPTWVYEHEATKVIMDETARSSFLSNDIVSLKKEIAAGEVDSIIPIIMNERKCSVQDAVDLTLTMLQDSYNSVRDAEQTLLSLRLDEKVEKDVKVLVQGCKNIILGGVHWACSTGRYLSRDCFQNGNIVIKL